MSLWFISDSFLCNVVLVFTHFDSLKLFKQCYIFLVLEMTFSTRALCQSKASDIFSFGIMLEAYVSYRTFKALFTEVVHTYLQRDFTACHGQAGRVRSCALNKIIQVV